MYSSLIQSWHGWSRIFYGCLGSFRRLAVALVILSLFSIFPWVSLVTSVAVLLGSSASFGTAWTWLAGAAVLAVGLQQSVMYRFYNLARSGRRWSAGYIVGAVICFGMLCNALLKLGGTTRVVWRGTAYRGHELDEQAKAPLAVPKPASAEAAAEDISIHAP